MDNSFLFFEVNVLYISSGIVNECWSENNSLNLSNTSVGKLLKFFKIKDFPPRIADKNNPGLNSNFISNKTPLSE